MLQTIEDVGSGSINSNASTSSSEDETESIYLTCKLCLCDDIIIDDMVCLQSCGCSFCSNCMKTYIEVLVQDGVVLSLTCPDADCKATGKLTEHEVENLTQPETFIKYKRLKFDQEVAMDPNRTFCPTASCGNVCHVCFNDASEQPKQVLSNDPILVVCSACDVRFCHICKAEWRGVHRCENDPQFDVAAAAGFNMQTLQDRFIKGAVEVTIKRCPVCNILIEKDQGCAQMICKNCSHVFCWHCLKLLDNDFMLRHYDKGPCQNLLGHSRGQVIRHRMGVVGLFAAFSLLLVVASPVLLLAAPAILCCKCKECCQQAINNVNQRRRESVEMRNQRSTSRPSSNNGAKNTSKNTSTSKSTSASRNTNTSRNTNNTGSSRPSSTIIVAHQSTNTPATSHDDVIEAESL